MPKGRASTEPDRDANSFANPKRHKEKSAVSIEADVAGDDRQKLNAQQRQFGGSRRLGRPIKPPTAGKRMSLGLKVTADIKERLDNAAQANGRTQSQEAELRLERSFEREDLLSEALTLAFGRPLAGLLLTLGVAMNISGSIEFGQHSFENVVHLGDSWLDNPTAVDEAITAATTLLNSVRPRGDISEARTDAGHATAKAIIALVDGVHMIRSLVRSEPGRLNYQVGLKLSDGVVVPMKIKADVVEAPKIRSLLGPLQLRMARYIDDSEK